MTSSINILLSIIIAVLKLSPHAFIYKASFGITSLRIWALNISLLLKICSYVSQFGDVKTRFDKLVWSLPLLLV